MKETFLAVERPWLWKVALRTGQMGCGFSPALWEEEPCGKPGI